MKTFYFLFIMSFLLILIGLLNTNEQKKINYFDINKITNNINIKNIVISDSNLFYYENKLNLDIHNNNDLSISKVYLTFILTDNNSNILLNKSLLYKISGGINSFDIKNVSFYTNVLNNITIRENYKLEIKITSVELEDKFITFIKNINK